jgi:Fe-S cluster biogenesis protein NfuA
MKDRIEEVLKLLRPKLAIHRGSVELVGVDEVQGIVQVKLTGACDGCPMADLTMKYGIEAVLREAIPEIREVLAV